MEQWMMDAEGDRVIHQRRRTGKLAVVVAVQNVVVAACLIATLFLYLDFQKDTSADTTVHIEFEPFTVSTENGNGNITLEFQQIASNYSMDLNTDKKTIYIKCRGPYIWYTDVCFKPVEDEVPAEGRLELKMADATVSYVTLNATSEVCRGHHSIVYLRANMESSVQLITIKQFKLMNVTVGLSYLLGNRCDF